MEIVLSEAEIMVALTEYAGREKSIAPGEYVVRMEARRKSFIPPRYEFMAVLEPKIEVGEG